MVLDESALLTIVYFCHRVRTRSFLTWSTSRTCCRRPPSSLRRDSNPRWVSFLVWSGCFSSGKSWSIKSSDTAQQKWTFLKPVSHRKVKRIPWLCKNLTGNLSWFTLVDVDCRILEMLLVANTAKLMVNVVLRCILSGMALFNMANGSQSQCTKDEISVP